MNLIILQDRIYKLYEVDHDDKKDQLDGSLRRSKNGDQCWAKMIENLAENRETVFVAD